MTYVKINDVEYEALVSGLMKDSSWDERASKTINFAEGEMDYENASALFVDGATWSIITEDEVTDFDEEGNPVGTHTERTEFDNSDYNLAGDITDHRDGRISVKMGKLSDIEELIEEIYGGDL